MARNRRIEAFDEPRIRKLDPVAIIEALNLLRLVLDEQLGRFDGLNRRFLQGVTFEELNADPPDPDEGEWVMWMSDGSGSGDDGDVLLKITAGGTTKTATLVDFSAV